MSKSLMYEVWTVHENNSFGVFLCMSTETMCRKYVNEKIAAGVDPDTLVIIHFDDSPFEKAREAKPEWFGNH